MEKKLVEEKREVSEKRLRYFSKLEVDRDCLLEAVHSRKLDLSLLEVER